jgi:hypothetical protein
MREWIRNFLGYRDDYIEGLERANNELGATNKKLASSNIKLAIKSNSVIAMNKRFRSREEAFENELVFMVLDVELAKTRVKGITDDRDELQTEHEQLMDRYDAVILANDSTLNREINKLKGDLMCSADRSERYRFRCIKLETVLLNTRELVNEDFK